jgi:hypothetical protein
MPRWEWKKDGVGNVFLGGNYGIFILQGWVLRGFENRKSQVARGRKRLMADRSWLIGTKIG